MKGGTVLMKSKQEIAADIIKEIISDGKEHTSNDLKQKVKETMQGIGYTQFHDSWYYNGLAILIHASIAKRDGGMIKPSPNLLSNNTERKPEIMNASFRSDINSTQAHKPEPQTLMADRKAELFDGLVESVNGLMSDDSWYDIFRGIGMTDAEMKSMGLDLPELKVTGHTIEAMAEYVIDQIRKEDMGATQTHITIPIADLTARFKLDLEESGFAEDAFMEELFSHSEVDDAEIQSGELWIKPNEQVLSRGDPQIAMGNM